MTITAAVDGSALGNPGPAGWAWVVSEECWAAGGWAHATNNIGELTAVLELLRATVAAGLADEELHILADSQYAINVLTKWRHSWKHRGWRKADNQPIKNLELIQDLDAAMQGRNVTFEWVKGHAGDHLNELADTHARSAAEAYRDGRPIPSGPGFGTDTSDMPSSDSAGDGLPIYGTTLAPIPGGDPQMDGGPSDWGDAPLEPFGSYLIHDEGGARYGGGDYDDAPDASGIDRPGFGGDLLLDEESLPPEFALGTGDSPGAAGDEDGVRAGQEPTFSVWDGSQRAYGHGDTEGEYLAEAGPTVEWADSSGPAGENQADERGFGEEHADTGAKNGRWAAAPVGVLAENQHPRDGRADFAAQEEADDNGRRDRDSVPGSGFVGIAQDQETQDTDDAPSRAGTADAAKGDGAAPAAGSAGDAAPTTENTPAGAADSAVSSPDAPPPLPSRRARKTRAKNGSAPAAPAITEADMIGAQEALIEAWAAREEGTLQALTAPGCRRIWPNGQVRSSLLGPVPPNPQIAGIEANALGAGTWLVRHLLTWEGGASVETTIWLTGSGAMQVIHHQSTLVRQ